MVSLDDVTADLRMLRRRGLGELDERTLATRLPTLAVAARRVHNVPEDQPAPLRRLLTAAARQVFPADLRLAVEDLFGLADTFGRSLSYRQDAAAARFSPVPAKSTFRQSPQYTRRLVESLAAAVVGLAAGVTLNELRQQVADGLIDRTDLVDQGVALLAQGAGTVWLRGEAGTGKSVLAGQLAERLAPPHRVVRIRMGNSRVMDDDLLRAVNGPHMDVAAGRALFRRRLAEGDGISLVILDDASSPAQVAALDLHEARVPVVVTSRTAGPEGIATLHVGNLSSEDAEEAVRTLLPDLPVEHTVSLARLCRGRPLVISHICRYLRGTRLDVGIVLEGLELDTGRTLDAIESTTDRGLTAVYRGMLAQLATPGDVIAVLDTLLWISVEGLVSLPLGRAFLAHRFPGSVGAVLTSSAEVVLARHGLVSVVDNAFVIHALTAEVLRGLRREAMAEVLREFMDFVRTSPTGRSRSDMRSLMHRELVVTADLVDASPERGDLLCLGTTTWVRVWRHDDRPSPSAALYRIHSTGIAAQVDGGESRAMTDPEMEKLIAWAGDFYERVRWLSEYGVEGDAEPAENGDGFLHRLRRSINETRVDRGFFEARCGKRWRIGLVGAQAEGLPECPRCAEITWHDAVRDWQALRVTTTRRRLLADFDAAITASDVDRAQVLREQVDEFVERTRALHTVTLVRELADADTALAELVGANDPTRAFELHGKAATRYKLCVDHLTGDDLFFVLGRLAGAHSQQGFILLEADPQAARAAYERSAEAQRQRLVVRPGDQLVQDLLGMTLRTLASISAEDNPAGALALLDDSISLHLAVLTSSGDASSRRSLADATARKAALLRRLSSPDAVTASAEAADHYRVLLEADPDDPVLVRNANFEVYRVADANRDDQSPQALARWTHLESDARKLCDLLPGDPESLHNLGVILVRCVHAMRGGVDDERAARLSGEATSLFISLPDLCPDDDDTLRDAANALALLTEHDIPGRDAAARAALALFLRYLDRRPDDPDAARSAGRMLELEGGRLWSTDQTSAADHLARAVTWFRLSLQLRPDHLRTRYELAFAALNHANIVGRVDLYREAVDAFRRVLDVSLDDVGLSRWLVFALARQADLAWRDGDQEAARRASDEAVASCRSLPAVAAESTESLDVAHVLKVNADIHHDSGQAYEEVEHRYLAYLRVWPQDPRPHYELASLHAGRGEAGRAIGRLARWWRTTLETATLRRTQVSADPDFDPIRDDPRLVRLLAQDDGATSRRRSGGGY